MNLDWAKKWAGSFNAPDQMRSLYADSVAFEDVTFGHKETSADAVMAFFDGFVKSGDHRFEIVGYGGDANGGAVEWIWHATHGMDVMGAPAKGKQTKVRGVSVFRFQNGKVAEQRDYWDAGTLLRQIGALE